MTARTVRMAYGRHGYDLQLPEGAARWEAFSPQDHPALADPVAALEAAFARPTGAAPLREVVGPRDRVVVVTSDTTRPVPNRVLLPALIRHLGLGPERLTVLVGGGSHQACTREQWVELFGEEIVGDYRVVNHDAYDPDAVRRVGTTAAGGPVWLNRHYLEADRRIVLGFIEPHFFAGFSGGPKGIMPAVAGIDTILHFHRAGIIADPGSTWARLEGNPQQALSREVAAMAPPDFLVNVTLNLGKAITGVYCGHYLRAHEAGCAQAAREAMVPVPHRYPLVVTSNSGYPLDQNLYQTVKGMSAAARIVEDGGTILTLSECSRGVPDHGHFAELMAAGDSPGAILERIEAPGFSMLDQWQAQSLALILRRARVGLYSALDDETVRRCKLEPVGDPQAWLESFCRRWRQRHGESPRVALLPQGPLTIPEPTGPDAPPHRAARESLASVAAGGG